MTTTTRTEELQARRVEAELEERQFQKSHDAELYRRNQTVGNVKAVRETRAERLRAEAELIAVQIHEIDEALPDHRAEVEQILDQRQKLDADLVEAQRPLNDLEGRRRRLQTEYYRAVHEAQAFTQGTEAL